MQLLLQTNDSFESLVVQLQSLEVSKLLAVVNGRRLRVYNSEEEVPAALILESERANLLSGTTEYHYTDTATGDTYCFARKIEHRAR